MVVRLSDISSKTGNELLTSILELGFWPVTHVTLKASGQYIIIDIFETLYISSKNVLNILSAQK